MTQDEIKARVRPYVQRLAGDRRFSDADDVFRLGFVHSLEAVELCLFVETEFGLSIGEKDRVLDNFRSLDAIARLVQGRTS
jgi:methoxymalonate biosynthesis acyl carrier protein